MAWQAREDANGNKSTWVKKLPGQTSVTVSTHPDTVEGDLQIMVVNVSYSSSTYTPPGGWTEDIRSDGSNILLYHRFAPADGPESIQFTNLRAMANVWGYGGYIATASFHNDNPNLTLSSTQFDRWNQWTESYPDYPPTEVMSVPSLVDSTAESMILSIYNIGASDITLYDADGDGAGIHPQTDGMVKIMDGYCTTKCLGICYNTMTSDGPSGAQTAHNESVDPHFAFTAYGARYSIS